MQLIVAPKSPDEWMDLCRDQLRAAETLLKDKQPKVAWNMCGFAVEYALKAAIMSRERLNRWPDKATDEEIWTHDLRRLLKRLGHPPETFDPRDPVAPSLKLVLEWRRNQSYTAAKFELKVCRDMFEATSGVVKWTADRYRLNF